MIELDRSVVVTIVYVLILYVFLSRFFFGPITTILAERRQAIEGSLQKAQRRVEEVENKTLEYEAAIRNARADGYRHQEKILAEALEERAQLLAQAKRETEKAGQDARVRLAAQAQQAKQQLEHEVDDLVQALTATILRD